MEEKLNNLAKEVFLIQQDRMRIINEDNAHFVKLEEAIKRLGTIINELKIVDKAQIQVNQLFQQQLTELETRLKKEETKPLVTIPSSTHSAVPSAWKVPVSTSPLLVNKWWWFKK